MKQRALPISLIVLLLTCSIAIGQSKFYQTTNGSISFYSSAPVEDIEASSNAAVSVLNAENGLISIKVKIRSFEFEKSLMQEHFNENYMESERFPEASFKGKLKNEIDFNRESLQQNLLVGKLTVHGVTQDREIPVSIQVSGNSETINVETNFEVACKEHDIKIPKLLWENIAEVIQVKAKLKFKKLKE